MAGFRNDSFLWYNVPGWSELGLAIPNFGDDAASQNGSIRYLTEVTGRNLSAIMWHQDARLRTPPSINTITRMHKLVTRARDILAGRMVPSNKPNMEPTHVMPAPESFIIYPVPYFKVRNGWLKEYCQYIMLALSEAFQHTENAKGIEISVDFAQRFGQYFQRVYKLMATELLKIPAAEAEKADFTITDAQLASYNPALYFTSTEMIDTVSPVIEIPTEDDLKILTDGIPAINLPPLSPWPTTLTPNGSVSTQGVAGTPAPGSSSFAGSPGV